MIECYEMEVKLELKYKCDLQPLADLLKAKVQDDYLLWDIRLNWSQNSADASVNFILKNNSLLKEPLPIIGIGVNLYDLGPFDYLELDEDSIKDYFNQQE